MNLWAGCTFPSAGSPSQGDEGRAAERRLWAGPLKDGSAAFMQTSASHTPGCSPSGRRAAAGLATGTLEQSLSVNSGTEAVPEYLQGIW